MLWVLLDAVLVTLFLAGYLARAVDPRYVWWFQLVATVLPVLSGLVALVGCGFGLAGRWVPCGLHGLLFLLYVARLYPEGARGGAAGLGPPLTILTFNANPEKVGAEREQRMRALVEHEAPDVIALQEAPIVFVGEAPSPAMERMFFPMLTDKGYAAMLPGGASRDRFQLPVLSRIEWGDTHQYYAREGIGSEGRSSYTRAVLRWQGQGVAIYNVHLHSFTGMRPWQSGWSDVLRPSVWVEAMREYKGDFLARAAEADALREALEAERRPFIVCGDFNSTPHNWAYAHIADGLQDAFQQAGRGWGGTYHTRLPLFRIDHVLVSKEWEVREAHVSEEVASDHRPVIVELALRPRE